MKGRPSPVATAVVAVGYLVLMFAFALRADGGSSPLASPVGLGLAVMVQLAVGFVIARWWAVALPVAAVALAAVLGDPQSQDAEVPVWVGFAFRAPVLVAAMLVGVGAGVAVRRRSASTPE